MARETAGCLVCDACHAKRGVEAILETCLHSESKNSVEILQAIGDHGGLRPGGAGHCRGASGSHPMPLVIGKQAVPETGLPLP